MANKTTNFTMLKKAPKGYKRFREILPHDGFITLNPDAFKEMMTIIRKEPDKLQKNVYFNMVLDRLFAGGWGWYMRLGQSLSATRPITMASQLQESKRANGLQVLRMVKDMHIELQHKPNYIPMINQFIREFGGTILTRVQKQQQKNAKFNRAAAALTAGEKVQRKMKKQIKSALEKTR